MCKEYLVLERGCLIDWYLHRARRFNEDEKKQYAEWFREYGFVAVDEGIKLEYIKFDDCKSVVKDRKPDGSFCGCDNACYIIDETQWGTLLRLNEKNKKVAIIKEIDEEIDSCIEVIRNCESQGQLYTKEEAYKKKEEYNCIYNEGGYGYVPHYYTIEEFQYAQQKLNELKKRKMEYVQL